MPTLKMHWLSRSDAVSWSPRMFTIVCTAVW
jgi:hypothetical protein